MQQSPLVTPVKGVKVQHPRFGPCTVWFTRHDGQELLISLPNGEYRWVRTSAIRYRGFRVSRWS